MKQFEGNSKNVPPPRSSLLPPPVFSPTTSGAIRWQNEPWYDNFCLLATCQTSCMCSDWLTYSWMRLACSAAMRWMCRWNRRRLMNDWSGVSVLCRERLPAEILVQALKKNSSPHTFLLCCSPMCEWSRAQSEEQGCQGVVGRGSKRNVFSGTSAQGTTLTYRSLSVGGEEASQACDFQPSSLRPSRLTVVT